MGLLMPTINTKLTESTKEDGMAITSKIVAEQACKYARGFILKGSTQIVTNTFEKTQRQDLFKAVKDLRTLFKEEPELSLEINKEYQKFHRTIEMCQKFSLGNCQELALMALDYVVHSAPPSIRAEVYFIKGGDHVFLVVGRKKTVTPISLKLGARTLISVILGQIKFIRHLNILAKQKITTILRNLTMIILIRQKT